MVVKIINGLFRSMIAILATISIIIIVFSSFIEMINPTHFIKLLLVTEYPQCIFIVFTLILSRYPTPPLSMVNKSKHIYDCFHYQYYFTKMTDLATMKYLASTTTTVVIIFDYPSNYGLSEVLIPISKFKYEQLCATTTQMINCHH